MSRNLPLMILQKIQEAREAILKVVLSLVNVCRGRVQKCKTVRLERDDVGQVEKPVTAAVAGAPQQKVGGTNSTS